MITSTLLAALVAFVSSTEALPSSSSAKRGFTVDQVSSGKYRSGLLDLAFAHSKYGSVPARPEPNDVEYLSPVRLGSNNQTLMLQFNTGGADTWVYSTQLPRYRTKGHASYDPSVSGVQYEGEEWSVYYGPGFNASGNIFFDKVDIGGVTTTHQAVQAATHIGHAFKDDINFDGVLGLAFIQRNSATPKKVRSFMANVVNKLSKPVFAAALKHAAPGSWDFGYLNKNKYTGSISYKSVNNSDGFWRFTSEGYAVGRARTSKRISAIVVSDAEANYLPMSVCKDYYSKVRGAKYYAPSGFYYYPRNSTLPEFSLVINGALQTVPTSYMCIGRIAGGNCFGALQPSDRLIANILGYPFIKGRYVVFDYGRKRIGFARQRAKP